MSKLVQGIVAVCFGLVATTSCNPGMLLDSTEWPTEKPASKDIVGRWSVDPVDMKEVRRWSGLPEFACELLLKDDGSFDVSQLPARFVWATPGAFSERVSRTDLITRSGTWRLEAEKSDNPEHRYWRVRLTIAGEPSVDEREVYIFDRKPPYSLAVLDEDSDHDEGRYLSFLREGDVHAAPSNLKRK
jgi:hypothetical protein